MLAKKTYILAAAAAVFAILALGLTLELLSYRKADDARIIAQAEATTQSVASDLEGLLSRVESTARAMGETFGERDYTQTEIEDIVRREALAFPEIRGVTACYEPFGFSPDDRLFCPYYDKSTADFIYIEDSYDYTVEGPNTSWYTGVISSGAKWTEPYYGAAAQDWFIDFGVPFYWTSGPKAGEIRGMIDFALQADDFKNFVHERTVGKTGYEFLTTASGNFVTHPIANYVGNNNLKNLIEQEENTELLKGYDSLMADKAGFIPFYDTTNDDDALFFFQPLSVANYRLGIVFLRKDMAGATSKISRRIINIALAISAFLITIIAMYFGRDELDYWEIETLSWLTTALLVGMVCLIGALQHGKERTYGDKESAAIVDTTALGVFLETVDTRADSLKIDAPIKVPVGIWVERLEFADSYNVNLGGEVWAKYPIEFDENPDANIGIRFPQTSPFAEASLIEEIRREIVPAQEGKDGYLHIIWEFRVTLRLNLGYADFPFDKRHLDIEIAPPAADTDVVFIPALESYAFTNPSRKPGFSPDVKLAGSDITKAYFNFSINDFDTDFGFQSKTKFQSVPRLHYNVDLKRKLINAFITYLIPIFVALALIYILILACEKTEARQGIIESMAAFFFVLIFSHIDLRKDIVTADLIFIEYFYFATYLMVILSTANLIAYTKSKTSTFDFNENQLYRAAYFPIFLTLILVVMLAKFY